MYTPEQKVQGVFNLEAKWCTCVRRGCDMPGAGAVTTNRLPCASTRLPAATRTCRLTSGKLACATLSDREVELASQVSTLLATVGVSATGGSMRVRFVRLQSDEVQLAAEGEIAVPSGRGSRLRGAVLRRGHRPRYGSESMVELDDECRRRAQTRLVRPTVAAQLQAGSPSALGTYSDGLRGAMTAAVADGGAPVTPQQLQEAYAGLRRNPHPELVGGVRCAPVAAAAGAARDGIWIVFACGKGGPDGNKSW